METLHSTTFPRLPFINQHQPEYRENRQRANRRRDTRTWLHDREPRSLLTTPRTVTPPLPLCFETSALQLLATNHERGSHREREREREISVSAADLYPARVKKKKVGNKTPPFRISNSPLPQYPRYFSPPRSLISRDESAATPSARLSSLPFRKFSNLFYLFERAARPPQSSSYRRSIPLINYTEDGRAGFAPCQY